MPGLGAQLSVSTIGTNELQLVFVQFERFPHDVFQFPQSERMSCNNFQTAFDAHLAVHLSVSTIGTNELQQVVGGLLAREALSFSFHNRNE